MSCSEKKLKFVDVLFYNNTQNDFFILFEKKNHLLFIFMYLLYFKCIKIDNHL